MYKRQVRNAAPLPTATTLADAGCAVTPEALAPRVAACVRAWAERLAHGETAAVAQAVRARDVTLGRRVRTPQATGTAVDLGPDGELVVDTDAGRALVRHGPVEFA